MDSKALELALEICLKADVPPLLIGDTGIGKDQITKAVNKKIYGEDAYYLDRRLGELEPGDFIGRSHIENNKTVSCAPDWFPMNGEIGVLHFSEINRASSREMVNAIFEVIYDRKMYEYRLSPTVRLVASMNPDTDNSEFQVMMLEDPAFLRRFCQIKYEPSEKGWKGWAKKEQLDNRLIDVYCTNFKNFQRKLNYALKVIPTLSASEYINRMVNVIENDEFIKNNPLLKQSFLEELFAGMIGDVLAPVFYKEIFNPEKKISITPEEILKGTAIEKINEVINNGKVDILDNVCNKFITHLKTEKTELSDELCGNITDFYSNLPNDYLFGQIKKLSTLIDPQRIPLFQKFATNKKIFKIIEDYYKSVTKTEGEETTTD